MPALLAHLTPRRQREASNDPRRRIDRANEERPPDERRVRTIPDPGVTVANLKDGDALLLLRRISDVNAPSCATVAADVTRAAGFRSIPRPAAIS